MADIDVKLTRITVLDLAAFRTELGIRHTE